MNLNGEQLRSICPRLSQEKAEEYLPLLLAAALEGDITNPPRLAAWLATLGHESLDLTRLEENLRYTAKGLLRTWPKRFTPTLAAEMEGKPVAIASYVYSRRFGNGDISSGDGWRYRGRGFIQLTFKDNYRDAGNAIGVDLVMQPNLAATPAIAFRIAAWFWKSKGCNELADKYEFKEITRKINGGLLGLNEREARFEKAREVFGIS